LLSSLQLAVLLLLLNQFSVTKACNT